LANVSVDIQWKFFRPQVFEYFHLQQSLFAGKHGAGNGESPISGGDFIEI